MLWTFSKPVPSALWVQAWSATSAKVIPISRRRMMCAGCGAEANANCDCGVGYVPKAVRAAEAVKANPEKSDRAIAAEIGVSAPTVGKARREEATVNNFTVDARTGLDGKTRSVRRRITEAENNHEAATRRRVTAPSIGRGRQLRQTSQLGGPGRNCNIMLQLTFLGGHRRFGHILVCLPIKI
jgi:hypothetical protein